LESRRIHAEHGAMIPVDVGLLRVMSIGFLLPDAEQAVIWRGPMKTGAIKQFLKDVVWDELDYLVIDCPPGTGDEPLSITQLIPDAEGAIIVTTPQEVAIADVRKCVDFCRRLKLPVLGVVENMSGFACPGCGQITDVFKKGGGEKMALEMGVPFMARIPLDPSVGESGDAGLPCVHNSDAPSAKAFLRVAAVLCQRLAKAECHAP